MDLRRKSLLAGAALVGVVAVGNGLLVEQAVGARHEVQSFRQHGLALSAAVADLRASFYSDDDQMNMYVLLVATQPSQGKLAQDTYAQATEAAAHFADELATARSQSADPGLTALLDRSGTAMRAYSAFNDEVRAAVQAGDLRAASRIMTVDNGDASLALTAAVDGATARAQKLATEQLARVEAREATTIRVAVLVAVLTVLLLVGLGLAFLRVVLRPLLVVERGLTEIADGDGDLTRRLEPTTDDEVGRLAAAFDRFAERVHGLVQDVTSSARALAVGEADLQEASTSIGASAQQAAAQADVVSAAAEQVSRNVQSVATGAEEMGASIREIAQNAQEAARVAGSAVDVAARTNETVAKLGASSVEIGNVVKVITSIAEQTNLLALNATIEAARAGDAGKGFAVVAGEVKDLAQATAKATDDISRRIEAIQADTAGAVEAISQISQVIGQINDYQTTIASAVEEQTATTNEMSRSVAEAALGSASIAGTITGVAQAAADTQARVGGSRAAAEQVGGVSRDLSTLVARYRV
jgi:methyl-accepting chemotaxis protein